MKKINLGSGRLTKSGFDNIDKVQIIDNKGTALVDHVIDIEVEPLPCPADSIEEICADNVFEHLDNFIFALNECHRVLQKDGILFGVVPMAGTDADFSDPTHKRHFTKKTFEYFVGDNPALPGQPRHPKYANYGIKTWIKKDLMQDDNGLIHFVLTPKK